MINHKQGPRLQKAYYTFCPIRALSSKPWIKSLYQKDKGTLSLLLDLNSLGIPEGHQRARSFLPFYPITLGFSIGHVQYKAMILRQQDCYGPGHVLD